MKYLEPNKPGTKFQFQERYLNYINGTWVMPRNEQFFEVISPIDGQIYTNVARSDSQDIELALDAAHAAFPAWSQTSATERSNILNRIADRLEQSIEKFALAETWGNGKPIRETLAADLPLAVDHFRYYAGVIRAEEGRMAELDNKTVSYHINEPLGIVGQIIPWNFPLLMAVWKIAPALITGNCIVLKPAEQTPITALMLAELIGDLLPKGVLNVVNGYGLEAGKPLATSKRIAKVAFTGETNTGRLIMQYASENIIPVTLELGGKSPNIFMEDIFDQEDSFVQKALEGFSLFAFNQGEVCTCPSRALVHEKIYSRFIEMAIARIQKIKVGHPLDTETMVGAVASSDQFEKILSYINTGKSEGARLLTGGRALKIENLENGFYIEPTVFEGQNSMRIFREEIFGPVLSVTKFKDKDEALQIANDTNFGLGAGLWTRQVHNAYEMARQIKAGRIWTNCYHLYPAHAAFGGYKQSGIGREGHKMMLSHYSQTKNIIVSYDKNPMGFF
jgi:aldehyde dehydrogenase